MSSDNKVLIAPRLRLGLRTTTFAVRKAASLGTTILAALSSATVFADDVSGTYPSRSIQFIVPFPPGGLTDRLARTLSQKLSDSLGQPVVVVNKPGAGGTIGMAALARSKPDGYTIGLGSHATHAINITLMAGQLGYDAMKDFAPVSLLATVPNLLLVHPSVPAKSVGELIQFAKAHPGSLHYVSQGVGTSGHIAAEMFAHRVGIEIVHIPERGGAQAQTSIIGGHTEMLFDSIALSMPYVRAAKLKALAITSKNRSPVAPEIPTMAEAGVSGCEFTLWFGAYAPAGVPTPIINKLNGEIVRALEQADVREAFGGQGLAIIASSPHELAAHQRREIAYWAPIIKSTGAASH